MKLYYKEIYLSDNPPSPGKAGHINGVYVLYSVSEQWCRFFVTSHNFRPYPWSLESLTLLQMSSQRQHFLLSCLKTLSVGPAGV